MQNNGLLAFVVNFFKKYQGLIVALMRLLVKEFIIYFPCLIFVYELSLFQVEVTQIKSSRLVFSLFIYLLFNAKKMSAMKIKNLDVY